MPYDQKTLFEKLVGATKSYTKVAMSHPLGRQAPMASLMRILRWQIASSMYRFPMIVPFVDDTVIVAEKSYGGVYVVYAGLWEPAEMSFMLHLLRPGDLFGDIGANMGHYTILAAGVRNARCVTVEPVPQTIEKLRFNIHLNKLEKLIEVCPIGIAGTPGKLTFTTKHDSENRVATNGEDGVVVPTETLDNVFQDGAPLLLKVDVEGFEHAVFSGGQRTLADPALKAIVVELIGLGDRYGRGDASIDAMLQHHGFEPIDYDFRTRAIRPATDRSTEIYVRDRDWIVQRLAAAPKFTVPILHQTI